MSESRPSEALFVRSILPFCKSIGPIWVHNIAIERQQRRENIHMTKLPKSKKNSKKLKKEQALWAHHSSEQDKVRSKEVSLCVTLLRKLYREIKPNCLGELMKAWMGYSNSLAAVDPCVFTRGDSKGHMRRVDGGRGADKVWRLDVLVAILYHGVPLSSGDSGMIIHTCQRELCIRPQHLRFRVSSISIMLAMKVLNERGYQIKKNKDFNDSSDNKSSTDEFVDMSGPFDIESLNNLKTDNIQVTNTSNMKLYTNNDDIQILNNETQLKDHYFQQLQLFNESSHNSNAKQYQVNQSNTPIENPNDAEYPSNQNLSHPSPSSLLEKQDDTSPLELLDQNNNPVAMVCATDETRLTLVKSEECTKISRRTAHKSRMENDERELVEILVQSKLQKHHNNHHQQHTVTAVANGKYLTHTHLAQLPANPPINATSNWIDLLLGDGVTASRTTNDSLHDMTITPINNVRLTPGFFRTSSERRRSTESKYSRDDDMNEFVDMVCSMTCYYKRESSLKLTPSIFSPISDSEEFVKAAE